MSSDLCVPVVWSACAKATGKLAVWLHSLSTRPADFIHNVLSTSDLHTLLQPIMRVLVHRKSTVTNRLKTRSFHTFHLAYYYNYINIYKSSKGLTQ